MKRTIFKWVLRVLAGLLALLLVAVGVFILRDRILYREFYKVAEKGMKTRTLERIRTAGLRLLRRKGRLSCVRLSEVGKGIPYLHPRR